MNEIRFDWDPRKASSNEKKHGVSFEEAQSVLLRRAGAAPRGSAATTRRRAIRAARPARLDVIRIISARKATRLEAREYELRLS